MDATLIRQLVDTVRHRLPAAPDLCRGQGFGSADLASPEFRLSRAQAVQIIRRAVRLLGDADLGLRLGANLPVVTWGTCLIGMLASRSSTDALGLAVDFMPGVGQLLQLRRELTPAGLQITASADPADDDIAGFLVQYAFAALVRVGRFAVAPWFQPQSVDFSAAAAPDAGVERHALGVEATRGARSNSMLFAPVEHLIATAHAPVARMVRGLLEKEIERNEPLSALETAIVRMVRNSNGPLPTVQAFALSVNLSERTLRRRLAQDGLSYAALIDRERMRHVLLRLRERHANLQLLADEFGYSDSRALRRAVKRWTGHTPVQIRAADTTAVAALAAAPPPAAPPAPPASPATPTAAPSTAQPAGRKRRR